jgi:hypothetical protein
VVDTMTGPKPLAVRIGAWCVAIFGVAYAFALAVFLIGEFDLFG